MFGVFFLSRKNILYDPLGLPGSISSDLFGTLMSYVIIEYGCCKVKVFCTDRN